MYHYCVTYLVGVVMSPELKKSYALLGVSPKDDAATVKAAWRRLVRNYHPDQAKTDLDEANKRLAEINAAFDAVRAAEKRDAKAETYERLRKRAREQALRREAARFRAAAEEKVKKETQKKREQAAKAQEPKSPSAPQASNSNIRPVQLCRTWSTEQSRATRQAASGFQTSRVLFQRPLTRFAHVKFV
jgi:curved DNA-binding protein CbpA